MTLPPPVTEILNTLLASLQDSLGENLVGLYLRGSLALGDFIPDRSPQLSGFTAWLEPKAAETQYDCAYCLDQALEPVSLNHG
jgi:hypothetical protein